MAAAVAPSRRAGHDAHFAAPQYPDSGPCTHGWPGRSSGLRQMGFAPTGIEVTPTCYAHRRGVRPRPARRGLSCLPHGGDPSTSGTRARMRGSDRDHRPGCGGEEGQTPLVEPGAGKGGPKGTEVDAQIALDLGVPVRRSRGAPTRGCSSMKESGLAAQAGAFRAGPSAGRSDGEPLVEGGRTRSTPRRSAPTRGMRTQYRPASHEYKWSVSLRGMARHLERAGSIIRGGWLDTIMKGMSSGGGGPPQPAAGTRTSRRTSAPSSTPGATWCNRDDRTGHPLCGMGRSQRSV